MLRVVCYRGAWATTSCGGVNRGRDFAVFQSPDDLEQSSSACPELLYSEPVHEPCLGTLERQRLCRELSALCTSPPALSVTVGAHSYNRGDVYAQPMPFQHKRIAARYYRAQPETLLLAMKQATDFQPVWDRHSVDERCAIIEKAANIISGESRQRIVAAAMIGQAMTAMQAELNVCQLVDYMRSGCVYMRSLTKCRYVMDGGEEAYNRSQYHGLEGFWAAITPSDSIATASQLAITPLIMGNCVVWKPSEHAVLACQRVFECLQSAGLPADAMNFVPAHEKDFFSLVTSNKNLAGISFAGTTTTLEHIWQTVADRLGHYIHFPRIVGTGSGRNFHVVHSSAKMHIAVSCTVRAAFEMAGQKSVSCSRVFVARSVLDNFLTLLQSAVRPLFVSHPVDYRCFTSSLVSEEAYEKVVGFLKGTVNDKKLLLVNGGRFDDTVGYYVEPTVFLVQDPTHRLMTSEVRGPVLAVCAFADQDPKGLERAVSHAPYAITGSIFAQTRFVTMPYCEQDREWARWAVSALRAAAPTLHVNDGCSQERPAQHSVGGVRKSGTGAKAGSFSYLLQFGTERSLREVLRPSAHVSHAYMDEPPPDRVQ